LISHPCGRLGIGLAADAKPHRIEHSLGCIEERLRASRINRINDVGASPADGEPKRRRFPAFDELGAAPELVA
jgi:hypothetical protein